MIFTDKDIEGAFAIANASIDNLVESIGEDRDTSIVDLVAAHYEEMMRIALKLNKED